jgi:hypothetical protein
MQGSLFDRYVPTAGRTPAGVAGSTRGAEAIGEKAAVLREQVFAAIAAAGPEGMTDREIQRAVGIKGDTERPRRWELWTAGRIKMLRDEDGTPIYRRAGIRVRACIWVVGQERLCAHCGQVYTKTRFSAEFD